MLELKRNATETGIVVDDFNTGQIMPWEWYWHDPVRNLNFSIDTVKYWKDQASKNNLSANIALQKQIDADYRSKAADKKSLVTDAKYEYLDTLYKQE